MGNWFGKLLPIITSMDNCQPEQALEPGNITPDAPEPSDPTEIYLTMNLKIMPVLAPRLLLFRKPLIKKFQMEKGITCQPLPVEKNLGHKQMLS